MHRIIIVEYITQDDYSQVTLQSWAYEYSLAVDGRQYLLSSFKAQSRSRKLPILSPRYAILAKSAHGFAGDSTPNTLTTVRHLPYLQKFVRQDQNTFANSVARSDREVYEEIDPAHALLPTFVITASDARPSPPTDTASAADLHHSSHLPCF